MITKSKVRYDAKADVLYLFSEEGEIARSINSHDPEGDSAGCLPARGFAT
jgi:hypothetical protein